MTERLSEHFKERAAWFAKARLSVQRWAAPPSDLFATRYRPALGGQLVRPADMPEHGYQTREDAVAGGRAFKEACLQALQVAALAETQKG